MPARLPMRLQAWAKVNLFLRVVGRRADGYHELETVYQSISLGDEVRLDPISEPWDPSRPSLSCDDPTIPVDGTNLAWRAAVKLAERVMEVPYGVRIGLAK